jgi:protein-tyrosine kinase
VSKIEKALNRAREGHGSLQVVPLAGNASARGTAVLDRSAHPETIPRMAENEVRMLGSGDLFERRIIQPRQSDDPIVQVFRELRSKIVERSQGRNSVILVSSVTKGCGSTFVSQNLAAAFAFEASKTALLIDCNLRNPGAHELLVDAEAPGLADYLRDPDLDIKDIVHPVGIARYRVISAGKQREIVEEHLTSGKLKGLMDAARQRYPERFIIMDGPPMSNMADLQVLAGMADHILLVARYARCTNTQIASCVKAIGEKKLLGIVFNEEPRIPRIR